MNVFQLEDRSTWSLGRQLAAKFLSQKNGESQHNISAIGHCHIDTGNHLSLETTNVLSKGKEIVNPRETSLSMALAVC